MMKSYITILFIGLLLLSCKNKYENNDNKLIFKQSSIVNSRNTNKIGDLDIMNDSLKLDAEEELVDTLPASILQKWKDEVSKNGNEYFYNQLFLYYGDHPDKEEEMIYYTQIMIDKSKRKESFMLLYYIYVEASRSPSKNKLMTKAINYLNILAKQEDDLESVQARPILANIFREGVYVNRDTIIANYLDKGGRNMDSIFHARGLQ